MKIVLTGATGLLGRSFIENCNPEDEYICLVRDPEAKLLKNIEHIQFLEQDLSKPLDIKRLPACIDGVVHLAQSLNYRDTCGSTEDIFNINVYSTFNLLEYAKKANASYFMYSSTGSVYEENYHQTSEGAYVSPHSLYASSKLAGEILLRSYRNYFDTCIMRLFFLYGKYQKSDRLIAKIYENIKNGLPIILHNEEGLKFTPTYCDDVVTIIKKALKEKWRGCYNVASFEITTIKEVSLKLGELLGKAPLFLTSPSIKPSCIIPNLECLKQVYTQTQFTSLREGLSKTFIEN